MNFVTLDLTQGGRWREEGRGRNGKYSNWFLFCRSEDKKTNDAPLEISILPKGEGVWQSGEQTINHHPTILAFLPWELPTNYWRLRDILGYLVPDLNWTRRSEGGKWVSQLFQWMKFKEQRERGREGEDSRQVRLGTVTINLTEI